MSSIHHQQVKAGFNRAAAHYDDFAGLQRMVARELFEKAKLSLPAVNTWLDVGCGTGFLQELLRSHGHQNPLLQLDISPAMCAIANRYASDPAYGQTVTIAGDMAQLPLVDAAVHGVMSSLALQWSDAMEQTLGEIKRVLEPKGVLYASIMGSGSLQELAACYQHLGRKAPIQAFISLEELQKTAESVFQGEVNIIEKPITLHYENVMQLLKGLRGIGASYKGKREQLASKGFFAQLESEYQRRYGMEAGVPATWNILYIEARNA